MDQKLRDLKLEDQKPAVHGLRHSVWNQDGLQVKYPKLETDISADVVIIGAGIAGLSVAYNLAKNGKSVVVLEYRVRGGGNTGRTTAHLMQWFDDFYSLVEKAHGEEKTALVADAQRRCIDWVEKIVTEEQIDCKFSRLDGYLFPHDSSKETLELLQKEFEVSKKHGFPVSMVDLSGDPRHGKIVGAIKYPNCAEFHPLMYIEGLAQAVEKYGGKIYENTRAYTIEAGKVVTDDKKTVRAGAVVMATNSPLNHDLTIHARQPPCRTYAIALKVPKGSVPRSQWWDTLDAYHYVRLEEVPGVDYDLLIVGGEDTSTGMMAEQLLNHQPYKKLEDWTRERWTMVGEVTNRWTGQVFEPVDYLHLIGKEPLRSNDEEVYIVTGDSGQGMTYSAIAGMLITDLILRKANSWAKVFNPSRKFPITDKEVASSFGEEVVHTVQAYKDRLPGLGNEPVDIEDLLPCSGAVIQKGLKKVAVYKDAQGCVHQYSAVCPHMKATVKWNPIDGTFDCPAHGSIFDHSGKVICGPAKADLSPA
ncbi:hypothetical protein R1sor_015058 [Riccia sorocarpa]|uniref:Rieske domain-containing protein n=1 Tax=Riccia sorocarpa TaxID=122646 RepID=A0ABD3HF18_9MARC